MKNRFLRNEMWMLSLQGGFQRAYCYNLSTKDIEARKVVFKKSLRAHIDDNLLPQYSQEISDERHMANIRSIIELSQQYAEIFSKGMINFGISQKILNLYLKYLWVAGVIPTPPHFPVDRIIQEKLRIRDLQPWTQFELGDGKYEAVIEAARAILYERKLKKTELADEAFNSLAELELHLFDRR